MGEIFEGLAYCMKCKQKREFFGEVDVINGRRIARGLCPECGCAVTRIVGRAVRT